MGSEMCIRDSVPLAPTGGIGPLEMDTTAALAALQPQPVPPSLPGPVDAEGIRSRIMAQAGPEPVAPPVEPTPLIIRLARALMGFGAGTQGQGPQFLASYRSNARRRNVNSGQGKSASIRTSGTLA